MRIKVCIEQQCRFRSLKLAIREKPHFLRSHKNKRKKQQQQLRWKLRRKAVIVGRSSSLHLQRCMSSVGVARQMIRSKLDLESGREMKLTCWLSLIQGAWSTTGAARSTRQDILAANMEWLSYDDNLEPRGRERELLFARLQFWLGIGLLLGADWWFASRLIAGHEIKWANNQ